MKVNRVWLWLVPLAILWPGIQFLVACIRFGGLPSADINNLFLAFLPMSLVSGIVFLLLWIRAGSRPQRTGLILGYLLASPFAFIGSLLSGLVYSPIVGTLLWGAIPLVAGMLVGVMIGYVFKRRKYEYKT